MKSASHKLLKLVAAVLTSSALTTANSAQAGHGSHGGGNSHSSGGGHSSHGGGSSQGRGQDSRSQGNGNFSSKSAKLDSAVKKTSGVQGGAVDKVAKSKILTAPNTKVEQVGKLPGGIATKLPSGDKLSKTFPGGKKLPTTELPKGPNGAGGKIPFPGGKLPTTPELPNGPKGPSGKIPFPGGKVPFPGGKIPTPGNPKPLPPNDHGHHDDHHHDDHHHAHHYCHPSWTSFCWTTPVVVLPPCEPVFVTEVVREVVVAPREVAVAQPVDLQVTDIRLLDAGDAARQAGPTYRLTVRNNSPAAIAQPFDMVLMASVGEKPTETSPFSTARIEALAGGASQSADIRLPVDVFQMGLSAEGQPLSYASLFAAADANQEVTESDEANNALAVARSAVPAAEAVAQVSP